MFIALLTVWLLYVAAMVSPGANVLLVTQLAASDRVRSARFAALGITCGSAMWCVSAILGVQAIFVVFPVLRVILQIAGGLYLLYLASYLWRSSSEAIAASPSFLTARTAFSRGLLTNITNPKAALFFGSVFAASLPRSPSATLQCAAVAVVICTSLSWHLLLAYVFSRDRVRSMYSHARNTLNRLAGVVFGTIGLGLLVATLKEARR